MEVSDWAHEFDLLAGTAEYNGNLRIGNDKNRKQNQ